MNPFDPVESFWRTLELWAWLLEYGWMVFPAGMAVMVLIDLYHRWIKPPGSEPDGSQRK